MFAVGVLGVVVLCLHAWPLPKVLWWLSRNLKAFRDAGRYPKWPRSPVVGVEPDRRTLRGASRTADAAAYEWSEPR